jgi:predicted CXXCH cytochrome family protein
MRKGIVVLLAVVALSLFTTVAVLAQVPEDDVLSGEQCGMCHPNEHADWASTAHPNSLENLRASGHAAESCLHCMSTDYRYDNTLTVDTAQYGVTCVACHTPHETPGDANPVIEDVAALCKDCHNAGLEQGATAEPGMTLRYTVKEMMGGYGAIGVEGAPSPHDIACNTCHLEGHLYVPEQSACDTCHGGAATIEEAGQAVRDFVETTGAIEGLAEGWPAAYTNYTMLANDDSGGIHNPPYAAAIVAAAEAELQEPPATTPEPTAEPVATEEPEATEEPAATAEPEATPEPVQLPTAGGVPVDAPTLLVLSGFLTLLGGVGAYIWDRRR